jgi:hypothetical protein
MKVITLILCLSFFFGISNLSVQKVAAQQETAKTNDKLDQRLFPVEDIKPGMKGVAYSVFSGSKPEEFGVEILGVLPGFPAPRQSAIIGRLTGENVQRTGVFAGMSGSPVFIDGRLVGAIAFSFPFSKEPLAGITPIKHMLEIFEHGKGNPQGRASEEPRSFSFTELAGTNWKPELPKPAITGNQSASPVSTAATHASQFNSFGQQLMPIATPLVFSGISADTLSHFMPQLQSNGLLPVVGVGGSAKITSLAKATDKTLEPGTSVSVQLVRGDYSIAAAGTVTFRDKDRIYAFGHPFLSLGSADMPMTEASVVSVVPNTYNSFKLSIPGQLVGAISQDRSTGIFGQLGQAPTMIPIKINLKTSRDQIQTYNYEVANDRFLTPLLLNITIFNTITSTERSLGESTISINGRIKVEGQSDIQIERRFSSIGSAAMGSMAIAAPIAALLTSGFENVRINGLTLDVTSTDQKSVGTLDRIAIDKTEVNRGETIEIQAFVRTESGRQFVQRIPIEIPSDIPPGQLIIFVGDGGALQQGMTLQGVTPKDLGQLVEAINKTRKNDRLYVKLFRPTPGVLIGTDELPNLPPSVVATLNSDRTSGGYTPTALSPLYEKELPPAEFVIAGQELISINIVR